jgi:hypothetical protein
MIRYSLLLPALLLIGGCATIRPAEMRMPEGFAARASMMPISGIGGGRHGRFNVGEYNGGFERSEQRLAIFDAFVKNYGHSAFTIEGPEISSYIDARCRMRERVIDLGIAEFKPKKMAYRCEFLADGRAFPARFELQEINEGLGGALSRNERRGEIALGGEIVQIRSIHKLADSPIAVANPIGYMFEQRGRPIGAVELNGQARLFIPDGTDGGLTRTMTIAAVTLAIFWDPANSALGD